MECSSGHGQPHCRHSDRLLRALATGAETPTATTTATLVLTQTLLPEGLFHVWPRAHSAEIRSASSSASAAPEFPAQKGTSLARPGRGALSIQILCRPSLAQTARPCASRRIRTDAPLDTHGPPRAPPAPLVAAGATPPPFSGGPPQHPPCARSCATVVAHPATARDGRHDRDAGSVSGNDVRHQLSCSRT